MCNIKENFIFVVIFCIRNINVSFTVINYLFVGDDYLLKMRVVDHVFDDMIVDELITKIILPEGAHDIHLSTPYPVERLPDSLHYTYLDVKGRPVVTIRKTNLVENHIQDFEVSISVSLY